MYNDLVNVTSQANIVVNAWHANKERITSHESEIQNLVNVGKFSFEFIFACRNFKKLLEYYHKVPSKHFEPFTSDFDKSRALLAELMEIEKWATKVWHDVSPRIESELGKQEWKKYLDHLDSTSGPAKYATDLGWI
jgi:hypothetical protein